MPSIATPTLGSQSGLLQLRSALRSRVDGQKLSGPSGQRGLLSTVIGMLDGLFVTTRAPTSSETKHPDDFRSGHKKVTGLNCQALCDSALRFLFV
jgi:hypothetical protein